MKSRKRYTQDKKRRVIEWIRLSLGEDNCVRKQNNGSTVHYTGLEKVNKYIFTRGDCKRYALLLANSFIQYKPCIIRIHKKEDWKSFHYLVYMLGDLWDANYPLTKQRTQQDIANGYKYKVVAKTMHKRLVWLDEQARDENMCNMEFIRLLHDMCPGCGFMTYHNFLVDDRNGVFRIKGGGYERIDLLNTIFNKELGDIGRGKGKNIWQKCIDYRNIYEEPLLDDLINFLDNDSE